MSSDNQNLSRLKVHPREIDHHQPVARFMLTIVNLFESQVILALKKTSYIDISRTDLNTLRYIDQDGLTVSELAQMSGVSKQAASKQIEQLVKRNYVQKVSDQKDGRVVLIKYSNKGLGLLNTIVKIIKSIETGYQKKIGKSNYHKLKKDLSLIIDLYN